MKSVWARDARYAVRRLVRTPGFTVGALIIIAVAIGANMAAFAAVDGMLFAPPPFGRPHEVVKIYQDSDDGVPSSSSYPAYRDMGALDGVFASVAATSPDQASLALGDGSRTVAIEYATSTLMDVIGRTVERGRWFDADMDRPGAGAFAVVSHHAWVNRFGADPSIVGRTLRFNNQPVTVVGVGPRGFNGVGRFLVTEFWLSISSTEVGGPFRVSNLERREDHWYDVDARLAPGVSVAQAQEAVDALALELAAAFPELNEGRGITVFPASGVRVHPQIDRSLYSAGGVLGGVVLLVLLLACTNLGSLLLVRGVSRRSEVAVRRALGADSGRVAGLFLMEALLLSVAGGLLGLLLARWLLGLLARVRLPGPMTGQLDLALDPRVLLFGAGLIVATGLFFGWAPALQSLRTDVAGTLREEGRSPGSGRKLSLFRNLMVAVQVAVSLVLVAGAAVMADSLASHARVDPGFDAERMAFVRADLSQAGIPSEARGTAIEELRRRLEGLPGVVGVSLTTRIPVQPGGSTTTVVEDYEPPSGTGSVELDFAVVTPDYFRTLGIDEVAGHVFTEGDRDGDRRSLVVNATAARRFWGSESGAVGRRVRPDGAPDAWRTVIGVVSDTRVRSLVEPPRPMLYYVLGRGAPSVVWLAARTAVDPASLLGPIRSELRAFDPLLPTDRITTGREHLGAGLVAFRVSAGLLGIFSLLALLLASVGIYTIVSFAVAGRMPEIGIRVALGAARGKVVRLVVGEVAGTVGLGLALGAAVVVAVGSRLGASIPGVDVLDPWNLVEAFFMLSGVVGAASYLPARRAARADPMSTLRS